MICSIIIYSIKGIFYFVYSCGAIPDFIKFARSCAFVEFGTHEKVAVAVLHVEFEALVEAFIVKSKQSFLHANAYLLHIKSWRDQRHRLYAAVVVFWQNIGYHISS